LSRKRFITLTAGPPATTSAAAASRISKFVRPPVNRAADEKGDSAVFGRMELSDQDKENSSKVPEQLLKQVLNFVL
jgi:hypothetical protein